MKLSAERIAYLLAQYSGGKATAEEEEELFNWAAKGNDKPVKEHIQKLVADYYAGESDLPVDWEQLYHRILTEKNSKGSHNIVRKISWLYWAAAAIALLLGTYYFISFPAQPGKSPVADSRQKPDADVAPPGAVNAVLTLANGQHVVLDSAGSGMLATQGSIKVVKLPDGQIAYQGRGHETAYNTLTNPRGSRVVALVLADGTKVWLNAESSLRYPTAFTGSQRKVEITGEAYFEVAHNPAMPFIVSKAATTVSVLGTHFNINAYDDEYSLNVTLLEGSVRIASTEGSESAVIRPGQQAQVKKNGKIATVSSVDLDEVMAWKNDLFSFRGADIESIMRQLSRWYDVDVVFEKQVKEKFYAEVSKSTNVSTLLKMLETTRAVRFNIEGKTIRVMP